MRKHQRTRLQLLAKPHRGGRERHLVLSDELLGVRTDLGDERGPLQRAQRAAEDRLPADRRERALDDHAIEVLEHELQIVRVAAPARRHRRAAGAPRRAGSRQSPGRNRESAAVSITPGAERVGDRHVARARGFDQSRDAERRIGTQFQRIAIAVVESPEDDVHRLQAVERLDEDPPIANGEVATLDERESEIARQIRVLEVRSRSAGPA